MRCSGRLRQGSGRTLGIPRRKHARKTTDSVPRTDSAYLRAECPQQSTCATASGSRLISPPRSFSQLLSVREPAGSKWVILYGRGDPESIFPMRRSGSRVLLPATDPIRPQSSAPRNTRRPLCHHGTGEEVVSRKGVVFSSDPPTCDGTSAVPYLPYPLRSRRVSCLAASAGR